MLKGIPKILSPELLKVLADMGHSDRLVISDGNFPAESMGKDAIVIRCDGHGVPEILDAILQVFPLDSYVEHPVNLMEVMPGDTVETPIWDTYKAVSYTHLALQKIISLSLQVLLLSSQYSVTYLQDAERTNFSSIIRDQLYE